MSLFCRLICLIPFILINPACATRQASLLIDAGSGGSRLHLFTYDTHYKTYAIEEIFSAKITPGLATFANKPNIELVAYLQPLFDGALQKIKTMHIKPEKVSVSILGTAGMRLLPQKSQQRIYQITRHFLKTHYQFPISKLETITGKMEGLYGWLDINYLANTFDVHTKSLGSIDMGGVSTQIAFEIPHSHFSKNTINININNHPYTIFVKSFMSSGIDQVRMNMITDVAASTCYPIAYPLSTQKGSFNFIECDRIYSGLIKKQGITQEMIPISKHKFIAYSGVFYAYQALKVLDNVEQKFVEKRIKNYCAEKTWDWWQQKYATESMKYLPHYCADITYIQHLLYQTYQIKGENLSVTNKVNNKNIDWTLGALFYQLLNGNHHSLPGA